MRVNRPVVVSAILTWFFFFHVAVAFGGVLILGVDLAKTMVEQGMGAFQAEYAATVKAENFYPLIKASIILIIIAGAWVMKRWGMALFIGFLFYRLYLHSIQPEISYWAVLALVFSMFFCYRSAYFRKVKKMEKPETHLYEGPVAQSSNEPKSAVEDLIY